ncbi:hypothetical protein CH35J_005038 [Colletotrichum higginsianum]|uniref:Uncharacterized protein n=1 Tax=Colletotrichum higginsianum TaxID=80884 RepID=A0A4T0W0S0_9PEZI|nr:hypothetical protein CH35J_005038 [Colletotrichum higginsianum]
MYRTTPWYHQPRPDNTRAWPNFGNNNIAGNRVNINNYGPASRTPFVGPGPRLFDFSQLFSVTNNFAAATPVRPGGGRAAQPTDRLRNRVTVALPDGSRVLVDRDVLHEHLPRTRNLMQDGYFGVPEFLRGYEHGIMDNVLDQRGFDEAFSRAATFVFRHLEDLSRSQPPAANRAGRDAFDLFARPRFLLANARDRAATVREIFWHVFVLCCVLDQDRALGCSEALARPVAAFLVELMPSVEAFLPPRAMQMLFLGFARIFRETGFELALLREMWELMDVVNQRAMRDLIGPQLAANGAGSNAQRIWTALRHLGLV